MRQKSDPEFAQTLSRVRTGHHTPEDIASLQQLESTKTDNFPGDVVYIYLTNKQVSHHNHQKIIDMPNKVTIHAKDCKREIRKRNIVPISITSENLYQTGGLPSSLTLAKGAKVMLTNNIDFSDNLVNGAICTLVEYDIDPQVAIRGLLYIKFPAENIGRQAKKSSRAHMKDCVPIKATTSTFLLTSQCPVPVQRTMFPITLAFAITAHKSQGSTYQHMVANLTLSSKMTSVQQGQI